ETVPSDLANRYDLVTNIGVGAGLLNQHNVFAAAHAFARPGGLMLHVLPFKIPPRGALFGYQPNFFEALARYNSYRTLGTWVAVDWTLSSFVPWEPRLLDFLTINGKTNHLLLILQQKVHDTEFCVPIQGVYEAMLPDVATSRYQLVVDGEYYSGRRFAQVIHAAPSNRTTISDYPATELARELRNRILRRLRLHSR